MGDLAVLAERLAMVAGDDDDGALGLATAMEGGEQPRHLRVDRRHLAAVGVAGVAARERLGRL